jgi:hypothetical protein
LVQRYFEVSRNPLLPVYLRAIGDVERAIAEFEAVGNVEEVVKCILANDQFEFFERHIDWLVRQNPVLAFPLFARPQMSPIRAINLAKQKYPQYALAIVRRIVCQSADRVTREEFANDYARTVLGLLLELEQRKFDVNRFLFCECVIGNRNEARERIADEVRESLIEVLKCNQDLINFEVLTHLVEKLEEPKVRIAILAAAGEQLRAMELLVKSGNLDQCEALCAESPELLCPFFGMMRGVLPENEFATKVIALIRKNLVHIKLDEAISFIPETVPIEEIAGFLEEAFLELDGARRAAEIRSAFSESDEAESRYERVRAQAKEFRVDGDTLCSICGKRLGFGYIVRTPEGRLCHRACGEQRAQQDARA